MASAKIKILLIRFSSFGDVTQCLSVPTRLMKLGPDVEVHWAIRAEFAPLVEKHPNVHRLWRLDRKLGLAGLWALAQKLRGENFTHVYDAHNNLRSHFIAWIVNAPKLLRKSQKRFLRFLLFRFRINKFERPFSGQRDLLEPLTKWGLEKTLPSTPQLFLPTEASAKAQELLGELATKSFVTVAASAAYPLKRWPLGHWQTLLKSESSRHFVLLGGPEDQFLDEIRAVAPERILNLAGRSSLVESAAIIAASQILITNDTGLLHVAEQLGKPCIALMGPAPFGFPSRPSTKIMEIDLICRPCSKHGQGPCRNSQLQKCLVDILPTQVSLELEKKAPLD
jgi:lipopolysaccharide heptosyltransferase II